MAGGQGTRFWPASRQIRPKQFLAIDQSRTLLQASLERLAPPLDASDLYVVCAPEYVDLVREQAPALPLQQILVEPTPRNTAACIGLAAWQLNQEHPGETMAVLPADHSITKTNRFHLCLEAGRLLAAKGWLVTFGIRPTYAATGYGYLKQGQALGRYGQEKAFRVDRFVEKPDRGRARLLLEDGRHFWNSGMFVWRIRDILDAIKTWMPSLYQVLQEMEKTPNDSERRLQLFQGLESISIDFGVMEHHSRVAMIGCDLGWSDIGSWKAVRDLLGDGRPAGSVRIYRQANDCLVRAPNDKLVALLGVDDLIVIDTEDALLVCDAERSEEVKKVVLELRQRKLDRYL